ncbi:MAG: phosphodiesterase, partial [Nocardioidaceae bacterium]
SRTPHERAFVAMHHPPADVHISLMDPIKLADADALADVLGRHDRIAALLVGHAHTMAVGSFAGVPLLFGGAVASTVPLDPEPGAPITHDLPPSYAVHLVDDDGAVMTHFRAVPSA